jgi:hypothetical protein
VSTCSAQVVATGGSCRDHKARTVACGRPVRAEDVRLSPLTPCERHCGHGCRRRTCEDDIANGQTVSIDPLNLLAVDAHANRSKGDGDTATLVPPSKPFRCAYVARQIAVKGKYDLWVTAAERDAMTRVVGTCSTMALPGPGSASTVAKSPSNQPNRAPPIQPAPAPAPPAGDVSYGTALRFVRRCCPDYAQPGYSRKLDRDGDGIACE